MHSLSILQLFEFSTGIIACEKLNESNDNQNQYRCTKLWISLQAIMQSFRTIQGIDSAHGLSSTRMILKWHTHKLCDCKPNFTSGTICVVNQNGGPATKSACTCKNMNITYSTRFLIHHDKRINICLIGNTDAQYESCEIEELLSMKCKHTINMWQNVLSSWKGVIKQQWVFFREL